MTSDSFWALQQIARATFESNNRACWKLRANSPSIPRLWNWATLCITCAWNSCMKREEKKKKRKKKPWTQMTVIIWKVNIPLKMHIVSCCRERSSVCSFYLFSPCHLKDGPNAFMAVSWIMFLGCDNAQPYDNSTLSHVSAMAQRASGFGNTSLDMRRSVIFQLPTLIIRYWYLSTNLLIKYGNFGFSLEAERSIML